MKTRHTCLLLGLFFFALLTRAQNRFDVVIHEIMADPAPPVGLPGSEWVELRNTTTAAINLSGWRIGDAAGLSGPMPPFVLQPDSCVVVCTASSVAGLSVFGSTIPVSAFPSLDNTGKLLYLRAPDGRTIHSVFYRLSWYNNAVKADGGWTLEMLDPHNPCNGVGNWMASIDPKGGTPGKKNSVNRVNTDTTGPRLLRGFAPDPFSCRLYFDEPLDSLRAVATSRYHISNGIGTPIAVTAIPPLYNQVLLRLGSPLQPGLVYTVTTTGVTDCTGNVMQPPGNCRTGLAALPDTLDMVLNEILFHPGAGGVDYVEYYNRSPKNINLQHLLLASRNTIGTLGTLYNLSADPYLLFPGDYLVVTENALLVRSHYTVRNPDAIIELSNMPSLPNDKGTLVLLDNTGKQLEELHYSEKWHFALIDNPAGIALERLDPTRPTNDPTNWSSAAATAGYGTPTYQNSQFHKPPAVQGTIRIVPEMISPDNDGFDDFAFIQFRFPEPGYTANITIYDAAGRPIRQLVHNATSAATGVFRWDGLNDDQQRVPVGIYVVYTEIFNLKGQKQQFRNTVAVARKF